MPGGQEPEQIKLIFALLGVPTEMEWPGVSQLAHVASGAVSLRSGPANRDLEERFMDLGSEGTRFLRGLLTYDPNRRLSARGALDHAYFRVRPLPQQIAFMPTFPTRHAQDRAPERHENLDNRTRAPEQGLGNRQGPKKQKFFL